MRPRQDFVRAFLELAGASIAALALGLAPLFIPAWRAGRLGAALAELTGRLFPFDARGLVHSYWAPNVWALYVFADRVLLKVLRRSAGAGATRGLVETAVEVLPAPGPKACALLTVLAGLPAVYAAARASNAAAARRLTYPCAAHAALAAFCFGWCPRPLPCLPFASTARHTARASRRWRMDGARRHRRDIHPGTRHRRVPRA